LPKFDSFHIEALKEYLYHSNIHDAKIEIIGYDIEKKKLMIKAVNPIFDDKISFVFDEIKVVLFVSSNEMGSRKTIISLTAEEDCSYLKKITNVCDDWLCNSIYLLFQMFSGDELHILSENVLINSVK